MLARGFQFTDEFGPVSDDLHHINRVVVTAGRADKAFDKASIELENAHL